MSTDYHTPAPPPIPALVAAHARVRMARRRIARDKGEAARRELERALFALVWAQRGGGR